MPLCQMPLCDDVGDFSDALERRLNVFSAGCIAKTGLTGGVKVCSWHDTDVGLLEQHQCCLIFVFVNGRKIRHGIKRPLRGRRLQPQFIQARHQQIPPRHVRFFGHLDKRVRLLVLVQRCCHRILRQGVGTAGHLPLQAGHQLNKVRRPHAVTNAPPCKGVGFARPVNNQRALRVVLGSRREGAFVDEVFVQIIGK